MKTFIKYPGGKAKELDVINEHKPNNIQRYFEPFVGGGSVFFDIDIDDSYINDLSSDLILLYTLIQNKNAVFLDKLKKLNVIWKDLSTSNWNTIDFSFISNNAGIFSIFEKYKETEEKRKNSRAKKIMSQNTCEFDTEKIAITALKAAFYCTIRYIYNTEKNDNIIRAISYYFMREFCYSSMFRFSASGDFNVPYGGASYNNKNFDSKIELIENYDIANTTIYNEDFGRFLERFNFNETDFIFVDPPYDSEFCDYDGNCFDKTEQVRLAEQLSKLPAKIMIIIKNTDFIYDLYHDKGFKILSFDKRYSVNFYNRNSRDVEHLMITNY